MDEVASSTSKDVKTSRHSSSGAARYTFSVLFVISLLNYLDRYVLTGGANKIALELGFGLADIGYISSAFLVVYTLATLPLGIWADHAKRKSVIAFSVAIWSVATALTALATNFATLFLSRMLLGIGEAGYFPAGNAMISDYFSRGKRARVMSWWSTAQLIGILGGFGIGGAIAGLYPGSWRLAFLFTGIPGLLLAFLIWRAREPRRNQADEEAIALEPYALNQAPEVHEVEHIVSVPPALFAQLTSLLKIRTLVILIVIEIFAYFVLGVNTTFLPIYLQQKDTFGLSSGQAGLYAGAVIVLAGIVGTLLGGYMADLLSRRYPGARVLVCGIGFLLSAPAFALAITSHNFVVFTVFFVITGLLLTIHTGPSSAATQDIVPSTLRASALAISLLIAHMLGDAFSPSLVGFIATTFDPTHGMHFQAGMAGHDLATALLITSTPALVIAGLVGVFGSRWMSADVARAERADTIRKHIDGI